MVRVKRWKKRFCSETLKVEREKEREQVKNKQRKVWINHQGGGGGGGAGAAGGGRGKQYIFSLWREENYRLLVTMCLAGHKWRDLEIVGSMFRGCGDQGELIQW